MALCTDDEETACFADLLCLFVADRLVFCIKLLVFCAGIENFGVICRGRAACIDYEALIHTAFSKIVLCEKISVTSEHNIRASTCHVGRNRNRAELTCLRDNLRFHLVVLCVEHNVRNFFAL